MSIAEETARLLARLENAAQCLTIRGYTDSHRGSAGEFARTFANSLFPLRLFCEWLERSPEAQAAILDALDEFRDNETGDETGDEAAGKWRVSVDLKAEPVAAEKPTQKSEPSGEPGVKGARAESVVIDMNTAAATILGKKGFTTRPVLPTDLNGPSGLGEVPSIPGQKPVNGPDGKPLTARVRLRDGLECRTEFLSKKGPLLLMRMLDGPHRGNIVTGPMEWVHPDERAAVAAVLNEIPGAEDEFNFSPFEGEADPWAVPPKS